MLTRRTVLSLGTAMAAFSLAGFAARAEEIFAVTRTGAEWQALLSPEAFAVLREAATERSRSSPLDHEYGPGIYHCAGCDLALFSSEAKFDSGTGWPSFWQPLPDAVRTRADFGWLGSRTEVHCRRCGGHLGHVFNDGPQPTGKRYCMNGVALAFRAA